MSNDELQANIGRLREIYDLLTGQPEPEEEEEAQKELTNLLPKIIEVVPPDSENKQLAEGILELVKNWDTLEQWFNEVEGLADKMGEFLSKFGSQEKSNEESSAKNKSETLTKTINDDEERKALEEKMKEMERKMRELEEKERLLKEKEAKLKALEQQKLNQSNYKTVPKEQPLKPKLSVPKIEIPKVQTPKKKITPSMIKVSPTIKTEPSQQKQQSTQTPKVKINTAAKPVIIKPKPIKITLPGKKTSNGAQTTSSIGQNQNQNQNQNSNQPAKIKVKPIIKPVSVGNNSISKIKPVGSHPKPQIKPVNIGAKSNQKPQIKPAVKSTVQPTIKPAVKLGVKPVIKPVSNISKPQIKPVGNVRQIKPVMPNNQQQGIQSANATSTAGMSQNLFNKKKTGSLNLFKKSGNKGNATPAAQSGVISGPIIKPVGSPMGTPNSPSPGQIQKIGGINKINYAAQASAVVKDNEEDEYAKMPPERLYHELIKLEAKQYYFDKQLKRIEKMRKEGQLSEADFRGERERYNFELSNYSDKIKKIRSIILGI